MCTYFNPGTVQIKPLVKTNLGENIWPLTKNKTKQKKRKQKQK